MSGRTANSPLPDTLPDNPPAEPAPQEQHAEGSTQVTQPEESFQTSESTQESTQEEPVKEPDVPLTEEQAAEATAGLPSNLGQVRLRREKGKKGEKAEFKFGSAPTPPQITPEKTEE